MDGKSVLYMGDDSLKGAAAYLGGVMTHAGIAFDYVPSSVQAPLEAYQRESGLFIISDYPASNLDMARQKALAESVGRGASLLMIGGWESFHGLAGEYNQGPVCDILPVIPLQSDDRVNYCQGAVPVLKGDQKCLAGLPWDRPPIFCGYNKVTLKDSRGQGLALRRLVIRDGAVTLEDKEFPLLVFGTQGKGRTAALTTDLAPHWVGGWVDWGEPRVKAQAAEGNEVEVGCHYAKFIEQLVRSLL
ncbi:glutamine amidotransferase [bacterium]|nr:glutamine amidotransferase [bacterium]